MVWTLPGLLARSNVVYQFSIQKVGMRIKDAQF